MNVFLCISGAQQLITHYLHYHSIRHTLVDTWNERDKRHMIPFDDIVSPSGNILICTPQQLAEHGDIGSVQLFLQKNHLIVCQDIDAFLFFAQSVLFRDSLKVLNQLGVPKNHLHLIMDATCCDPELYNGLDRFNIIEQKYTRFMARLGRVRQGRAEKKLDSRDFLITTVIKKTHHHRQILKNQIESRPSICNRAHIYFKKGPDDPWIGELPGSDYFAPDEPSMDLYRDTWLEIVPETLYDFGHFVTEKTLKPILTLTPFFMVSTPGYLAHLQSLGFKTFAHIVDESYDQEKNVEKRISLMLDQIEIVIHRGTSKFYEAAKDVVWHNQKKLAEISGLFQFEYDAMISDLIDLAVDQK